MQAKQVAIKEKPLLKVLAGEAVSSPPFWLMRQAGRYLPEYRAVREKLGGFLNLCFSPEDAAEVTLQPLRRYQMDAAIIFCDILVLPYALGYDVRFEAGEGPRITPLDLAAFNGAKKNDEFYARHVSCVEEALRLTRHELEDDKTLIGFAGAPWTVACYMIEGRGGTGFPSAVKAAAQKDKGLYALIDMLAEETAEYLSSQISAGADVVKIFDSWAGLCPDEAFDDMIVAPARKIVSYLKKKHPHVPVIGFPRGAGDKVTGYAEKTGIAGLALDQSANIAAVRSRVGENLCLQGNLDPEILLAGGKKMEAAVRKILGEAASQPFIFNLGHGIIKETPPEHVAHLARIIKEHQA